MRKINTGDTFAAMRVVKAAGIKDEIKRVALDIEDKRKKKIKFTQEMQKQMGAELFFSIIDGLAEQKAELLMYDFLAGPFEMDAKDIAALSIPEIFEKFGELSKMMAPEGWASFFSSLAAMIKPD